MFDDSDLFGQIRVLGKIIQIDSGYTIPINPSVLSDLERALLPVEPDLSEVATIVEEDVGLSAVVLKTMNSPLLGMQRQVTDIKQSVMLLGVSFFKQLSVLKFVRQVKADNYSISLERFWDSSRRLAFLTGELIEYLDIKTDIPFEDAYAAGLFLDGGIPVMARRFSNYMAVLEVANTTENAMFTETEESSLQTNHATMGYYVAKSWDLPDIISDVILGHHDDDYLQSNKNTDRHKDLFGIVKLAENILNKIRLGKAVNEWVLLKREVLEHFGLSDVDYQDLEQDMLERYVVEWG